MTSETRYMRSDIDSGSIYKLGTSQTSSSLAVLIGSGTSGIVYVGIRVYVQHADGSKTEITSGSAVAIVSMGTGVGYTTTLSATWACPQISLASTDKILVEVYGELSVNPPTVLRRSFITEQLGASQLDAVTWTVYYRIQRIRVYEEVWVYTWFFLHGTSTDNSRIGNFTWSIPSVGGGILVQII